MRQAIRLGRVAGVPVGLSWSALVLVALLAAAFGYGRLPFVAPGRGPAVYGFAGLVTAVLFLACILAHELAHVVVARANGIRVDAVTLWLLGGVSQLRDEPRGPGAEFAIAVVGPAGSLVLGAAFGGLAMVLSATGADPLAVDIAVYLGAVNLLLAAFNLVPAAPLDGGRVLRAAVWRLTGDRARAAVAAARAGRVFGLLLIAAGIASVLLTGGFGGLWWVLLGWFLVNAAAAEENRSVLGRRLRGVRVGDVMTPRPVTVDPDEPVDAFVDDVAMRHRFSTYPLVDGGGRLTGLVTLNRIRAVPPRQRSTTRLADIACPPAEVPVARPDEPLVDVLPDWTAAWTGAPWSSTPTTGWSVWCRRATSARSWPSAICAAPIRRKAGAVGRRPFDHGCMVWRTTGDVAEFVAAAGAFLRSRPAAHTVQLSIVDTLERRGGTAFGDGSPLFGWWPATGGAVTGAFLHTPPHPVLLTDVPEPAAADLAATLAAAGRPLSGINTGEQVARAFAAEWLRHTGTSAAVHQRLRLYRLGELAPPDPAPPGRARPGAPADRDLLLAWCEAFGRDVGKPGPVPPAVVDDRIDYGGLTLWEVGGAPVAMAGATRPLAGMVRVAPVYTPEALRRRGYAGAVTAAVSRAACDAGVTDVVLFTDLANPTSNAIYQRLGYRPVDDRVVLSFGA